MVSVPLFTAVARPVVEAMVAICGLLELHATWLVRFTVPPEAVVPMAINWLVCVGNETAWVPGMIVIEAMLPPADPPPEPVTVIRALELTGPLYAAALAVTVVVPALTAVISPEVLT